MPTVTVTPLTPSHFWIFQADPQRFDVATRIAPGRPDIWVVTNQAEEPAIEDVVYLWLAGSEDALYGWAVVSSEVFEAGEDKRRVLRKGSAAAPSADLRVELAYRVLFEKPLTKAEIRSRRELGAVGPTSADTNFLLKPTEALALNELIRERGLEAPPDPPQPDGAPTEPPSQLVRWERLSRSSKEALAWGAASERAAGRMGTRGILIGLSRLDERESEVLQLLRFVGRDPDELIQALREVRPLPEINPHVEEPVILADLPGVTPNAQSVLERAFQLQEDPSGLVEPMHLFGGILAAEKSRAYQAVASLFEGRIPMERLVESYPTYLAGTVGTVTFREFLDIQFPPDRPPSEGLPEARATSDRWTVVDELGYDVYADALRDFILNPSTPTPLAISIKGEWGSGKTSLMRMVRKRIDPMSLDGEDPEPAPPTAAESKRRWLSNRKTSLLRMLRKRIGPESLDGERPEPDLPTETQGRPSNRAVLEQLKKSPTERTLVANAPPPSETQNARRTDLPTVWFNAWIYQSSRQLWAGLAVAIINGVASRMSFSERERFWLTLQIRRIDGAGLRRRLYRELAQRILPKVAVFLVVSIAGLALWALQAIVALPKPVTALAGATFLVPLLSTPLYAMRARDKFLEEGLAPAFADLVREPDYGNETGFLHLFHQDMKLILEAAGVSEEKPLVIFVDDLDRCSYSTVAEVVEGLNLFLAGAFPHCIFVIGMEPTLVAAQLGVAYKDLFATLSGDDSAAARIRYGWKFLEKMVQLPLALPAPRASRLERYVSSLTSFSGDGAAPDAFEEPDENEIATQEQALVEELDRRGGALDEVAAAARAVDAAIDAAASEEEPAHDRSVHPAVVAAARRVVSRRASEDDPTVRQMYRDYADQLSGNPREFKRFLNLFRFYANLQITRELSPFPAPSLEQVGKITMLAVRWPDLVREFTTTTEDKSAVATIESLAGKHRTVNAWTTAAKKLSLPEATCAALLRSDIHTFLRHGPSIGDYADGFL